MAGKPSRKQKKKGIIFTNALNRQRLEKVEFTTHTSEFSRLGVSVVLSSF